MKKLFLFLMTGIFFLLAVGNAQSMSLTFYDETQFLNFAGSATTEGFETIPIDSWIYHTMLPAYIPALDLDDDPLDPNDGPNYDLDGHFSITGNNVAYAPADELFKIYDYTSPINGNYNFFSFSPWYNILWPKTFDPENEHPIITLDNFNNDNSSINALSFWYRPGVSDFIVFDLGPAGYVEIDPNQYEAGEWSFFGVISDVPFAQVKWHTNQNGSSIYLDDMSFSSDATLPTSPDPVPEPASLLLLGIGVVGLGGLRRKFRKS